MSIWRATVLVSVAILGLTAENATAYDGFGYAFPWFGYGNQGPAAYALGNIPAPPYFALHPPVYYSHRITPRSYGRSPFACPCDCHCAAGVAAAPRVLANPFVIRQIEPAKPSTQDTNVAATPLRIVNPFYELSRVDRGLAQDR